MKWRRWIWFGLLLAFWVACGNLTHGAAWQTALQQQTDPAKLATLGKRGANPRVNRIVYYLHQAQRDGTPPAEALDQAFRNNGTTSRIAALSKEISLLNYAHALEWGLLTEANLERLKRGQPATITQGRHHGDPTEVDHIVPISLAPEAGNSLANLEMLPASVNRSKGTRVGLRGLDMAKRLHEAGLIHSTTLWRVRAVFFFSKVLPWLALLATLVYFRFARRRPRPGLRGLLDRGWITEKKKLI